MDREYAVRDYLSTIGSLRADVSRLIVQLEAMRKERDEAIEIKKELLALSAGALSKTVGQIRAEALREAADQLTPIIPSPIGPLHAAGMMLCVEHLRAMAAKAEEVPSAT